MMRIPERAPSLECLIKEVISSNRFAEVIGPAARERLDDKYLHWDKLRQYDPPEGLSHREWWCAIKLRRRDQHRPAQLRDSEGHEFRYLLADPIAEHLHQIDLSLGGRIEMPEPIVNPEMKDRYLVGSLIEEAITSSQLEGAATTRPVAKEMIRTGRAPHDRGERMILNNFRTMERIGRLRDEPLTPDLVFEIHRLITTDTLDRPSAAGRLRQRDELIDVGDDPGNVFHKPPPVHELPSRLDTMCAFANGETPSHFMHPAIRSMILHFWLAYDHPFVDGNDLTYFLLHHVEVLRRAIDQLFAYVKRKTRELRNLERELRGITVLNYRQRALVGHAVRHPDHRYIFESHRRSHNVVYQTARTDLLNLAERGLLKSWKIGKTWHFTPVADLRGRLRELSQGP